MTSAFITRRATPDERVALDKLAAKCLDAHGGLPQLLDPDFAAALFPDDALILCRDATQQLVAALALTHESDDSAFFSLLILPTVTGDIATEIFAAAETLSTRRVQIFRCESVNPRTTDAFSAAGEQFFSEYVMSRPTHGMVPVDFSNPTHPWTDDNAPLFFAAYQGSFRERPGFPDPSQEEWIADQVESEEFHREWSRVALDESGTPLGFVVVDDDQIWQMGVIPAARRQGVGRQLLTHAVHALGALGKPDAWLNVNLNNPAAIALYESVGFEVVGQRSRFRREI